MNTNHLIANIVTVGRAIAHCPQCAVSSKNAKVCPEHSNVMNEHLQNNIQEILTAASQEKAKIDDAADKAIEKMASAVSKNGFN